MKEMRQLTPRRTWHKAENQKRKNKYNMAQLFHCLFCQHEGKNRSRVMKHMYSEHAQLVIQAQQQMMNEKQREEIMKNDQVRNNEQMVYQQQQQSRAPNKKSQQPIFLQNDQINQLSRMIFNRNHTRIQDVLIKKIQSKLSDSMACSLFSSRKQITEHVEQIFLQQVQELNFHSYSNLIEKKIEHFHHQLRISSKEKLTSSSWSRIKKGYDFFRKACNNSPGEFLYQVVLTGEYQRKAILNYSNKIIRNIPEFRMPMKLLFEDIDEKMSSFGRKLPQCNWKHLKNLVIDLFQQKNTQLALEILLIFYIGIPNATITNCHFQKKYKYLVNDDILIAYIPTSVRFGQRKISFQTFNKVRQFLLEKLGVFYSLFALRKRIFYSLVYDEKSFLELKQKKLIIFDEKLSKKIDDFFNFSMNIKPSKGIQTCFDIKSWQAKETQQIFVLIDEGDTLELLRKDSNIGLDQIDLTEILAKQMQIDEKYFIIIENYFLKSDNRLLVNKIFSNIESLFEFVDQQFQPGEIKRYLKQNNLDNSDQNKIKFFQKNNSCSMNVTTFIEHTTLPFETVEFKICKAKTSILIGLLKKKGNNFYYLAQHQSFIPQKILIQTLHYQQNQLIQDKVQIEQNALCLTERKPKCPSKSHEDKNYQFTLIECSLCEKLVIVCGFCKQKTYHECFDGISMPVPQEAFTILASNEAQILNRIQISFDQEPNLNSLALESIEYNQNLYLSSMFSMRINCQLLDYYPQIPYNALINNEDYLPLSYESKKIFSKRVIKQNTAIGILSGILRINEQVSAEEEQNTIFLNWLREENTESYKVLMLTFKPFRNFLSLCRISNQFSNCIVQLALVSQKIVALLVSTKEIKVQEQLIISKKAKNIEEGIMVSKKIPD